MLASVKDVFTPENMCRKPPKCCYPDCGECPYKDCRYDRLEVEDYTESNNRDYEFYENATGEKLHKPSDKAYQIGRAIAYQRRNRRYLDRHDYNHRYYLLHSEKIKEKARVSYDTVKNTKKCRKYANQNREHLKEYQKDYYLRNREKKLEAARKRYQERKLEEQYEIKRN